MTPYRPTSWIFSGVIKGMEEDIRSCRIDTKNLRAKYRSFREVFQKIKYYCIDTFYFVWFLSV